MRPRTAAHTDPRRPFPPLLPPFPLLLLLTRFPPRPPQVKNSVDEARAKLAVGAPGRSAAEGELEYYHAGCRLLQAAGVRLPDFGARL